MPLSVLLTFWLLLLLPNGVSSKALGEFFNTAREVNQVFQEQTLFFNQSAIFSAGVGTIFQLFALGDNSVDPKRAKKVLKLLDKLDSSGELSEAIEQQLFSNLINYDSNYDSSKGHFEFPPIKKPSETDNYFLYGVLAVVANLLVLVSLIFRPTKPPPFPLIISKRALISSSSSRSSKTRSATNSRNKENNKHSVDHKTINHPYENVSNCN